MKLLWLLTAGAGTLVCQILVDQSDFSSTKATEWNAFSQRQEIAPRTWVDSRYSRGSKGALAISAAGNPVASGGWRRKVEGIAPQNWYRLTAWYRAEGLTEE